MSDFEILVIGSILALFAGIFTGTGQVIEKKVVNSVPRNVNLGKTLIKKPLWILGFSFEMILSTVFYMSAQLFIGPSLIPGLMACSLIILALGSVKILKENLNRKEILGIAILIFGIVLLGFAGLQIEIMSYDLLNPGFILRSLLFTFVMFTLLISCYILQKRNDRKRGLLFAFSSGLMYALANLWISPLMGIIDQVLGGGANIPQITLFIWSAFMLVFTNFLAVSLLQKAYQFGQASNLISIQIVPIQIVPIFLYFFIFGFFALVPWSIPFAFLGVFLILYGSSQLSKRQELVKN
jgi:drug/metabolite transporter (DMT)-like permease